MDKDKKQQVLAGLSDVELSVMIAEKLGIFEGKIPPEHTAIDNLFKAIVEGFTLEELLNEEFARKSVRNN